MQPVSNDETFNSLCDLLDACFCRPVNQGKTGIP